ncbi:hypothetical protein OG601_45925 [Streptomyces sp. NBC_01239]|nr:hypothetical protein [Streptomyces sp. NBC_01239]MCX4817931.1 hypothetical protein [Streptomyces sp. NBC_01239]
MPASAQALLTALKPLIWNLVLSETRKADVCLFAVVRPSAWTC